MQAASRFALHLDPSWAAADGALAPAMHGIVTTYQQVATSAPAVRKLARGSFVIFDELHHAADERAWGDAIRHAFEDADRRLALSGTPFRSDTRAIPFVDYHLDEARPDFEYGYGDALRDRQVVRPVYFPRTNGQMEWAAPDGAEHSASFDEDLGSVRSSQRLRTALSLEGEWLPTVLRSAHDDETAPDEVAADEQMSLFVVISAVATDADGPADPDDPSNVDDDEGDGFELELGPPAPTGRFRWRPRRPPGGSDHHPPGGQEAPARPQRRAGPRPGAHHGVVPRPGQPGAEPHRGGDAGDRVHRRPAARPPGEGHPLAQPVGLTSYWRPAWRVRA